MSNKFIRKITIQNFKSIKELKDFELHNINILIGANGSGKSNFLSFFNFIHYLIEKKLGAYVAKKGRADGILTFSRKNSQYLSAQIEFEKNKYKFTLLPADDNSLYFSNECTIYTNPDDGTDHPFSDNSSHTETRLEDKLENGADRFYYAKHFVPQFKKILQYHFHDTGDTSPIKSGDYIYENEKLKFDGKNIAAFLYRLYTKEHDCYDMIVKTIRLVIPDFYDFHFSDSPESIYKIDLMWVNRNDLESTQHPSFLSDGSLRFICLATVLLQPIHLMPDIIIIDEPELGLHPQALIILANLIERVSLQKQFIIATQSSSFVDLFNPDDIIVVDKNEDGTSKFDRLDNKNLGNWLEEYNTSDLWDMNLIGGRP